jgi:hypothetical protein
MSLLLDNLMDALPMIGELTSAVPHRPEREAWQLEQAWQLVREAWSFGMSFGIVDVMQRYWRLTLAGCVGMFLILYGGSHLARASTSQDVNFVMNWTKVAWRGAPWAGCMFGGIALLLLALWKNQLQ